MRQLSPTIRPPRCQQSLSRSVVDGISLSQHLSVFLSFPFPLTPPSFLWHLHALLSPALSSSDSLIAKLKMVLILSGFLSLIWTHSLQLFFFFFSLFCNYFSSSDKSADCLWCLPVVAGWEVHVLPVRRGSAAGGSAHACHHGGVWLACFFYRHFQVPWVPGFHQHTEGNCGSQVMITLPLHVQTHTLFILSLYLWQPTRLSTRIISWCFVAALCAGTCRAWWL